MNSAYTRRTVLTRVNRSCRLYTQSTSPLSSDRGLPKEPISVAEYLFKRLRQVGVCSVHGVPGDFNLPALDYLPKADLKWVGNTNELNAGYAADGYARIKGIAALVTTFGVGELSAINALAGAFSELIPIVHIVGYPSLKMRQSKKLMHHTLGDYDFDIFSAMNAKVSCHTAKLEPALDMAQQIDDSLRRCFIDSRPVYLALPTDAIHNKVEGQRLTVPLDLEQEPNRAEEEEEVTDTILTRLRTAKKPAVLVDACALRHRVLDEVKALVEKANLPVFVTPMGRGAFDETHPNFRGLYAGKASNHATEQDFESSDLILSVGAVDGDFNMVGTCDESHRRKFINFHSTRTSVGYSEHPGLGMRGLLRNITNRVDQYRDSRVMPQAPNANVMSPSNAQESSPAISHAWFWPRLRSFFREEDIIIAEVGTAAFGMWDTKLPARVYTLSQLLWCSIGWSIGACQGAALASLDEGKDRRTILFVGDGSIQPTAQEISTMLRHNLRVTIFCICNEGYTTERLIHGMEAKYNDVSEWAYKDLATMFGKHGNGSKKFQVRTKTELEGLLKDEDFNSYKGLQFVELHMAKADAPLALLRTMQEVQATK